MKQEERIKQEALDSLIFDLESISKIYEYGGGLPESDILEEKDKVLRKVEDTLLELNNLNIRRKVLRIDNLCRKGINPLYALYKEAEGLDFGDTFKRVEHIVESKSKESYDLQMSLVKEDEKSIDNLIEQLKEYIMYFNHFETALERLEETLYQDDESSIMSNEEICKILEKENKYLQEYSQKLDKFTEEDFEKLDEAAKLWKEIRLTSKFYSLIDEVESAKHIYNYPTIDQLLNYLEGVCYETR